MRRFAYACSMVLLVAPLACGGDSSEDMAQDAAQSAADAMRQAADAMQDAAANLSSNASTDEGEPWTAQEMQDALPESLAGMDRTSSERSSTGAAGITMAQAQATYESEGRTLEVQMMSGGGIMAGPAMAFTMVEFDRADDNGYERTITHDGMKGMQEWEENGDYRRAVMMILVHSSLMVRLEAEGMTMDEVEDAFDDLDLG
ncbi:hypothetical protein [Gaopeijia maritima]|uniref:Lipoprotein n=1 Tax=Gaopeijia maritima TaxID=3119007 RepID=A0ABU9EF79_9BACT